MKKIAVVSGTRAEFGLLKKLLTVLYEESTVELQFFVTGSHLSRKYGNTLREIEESKIPVLKKIDISIDNNSTNSEAEIVSNSLSLSIMSFTKVFKKSSPDIVVVLGDRYEIFGVSQSAMLCGIPIAHIHGGERSEGSMDDQIRHAITKLSHLHFTSTEEYRKRVIQLGEDPLRVYNVGAMGIDAIRSINFMPKQELEEALEIQLSKKVILVTYHPETLCRVASNKGIDSLLIALDDFQEYQIIITYPNSDIYSDYIIDSILKYANERSNVLIFKSLGQKNYYSMLKFVSVVVGNSSSGLVEVPFFKVPTVNIGDRQAGRLSGDSVIHSDNTSKEISNAIAKALTDKFKQKVINSQNPYEGGHGAIEIKEVLLKTNLNLLRNKQFYDLSKEQE